jgi:hypothetical protein
MRKFDARYEIKLNFLLVVLDSTNKCNFYPIEKDVRKKRLTWALFL